MCVCVCFAGNPWSSLECPSRGLWPRIRGRHGALAGWHVLGTGAAGGRRLEPTCGDAALGVPPGRAPDLHRQQPRGSLAIGCNAWVKASGALWFQKISKIQVGSPSFEIRKGTRRGSSLSFGAEPRDPSFETPKTYGKEPRRAGIRTYFWQGDWFP